MENQHHKQTLQPFSRVEEAGIIQEETFRRLSRRFSFHGVSL